MPKTKETFTQAEVDEIMRKYREEHPAKPKPSKLFCCCRIVDYRWQWLSVDNEWTDYNDRTLVSADREAVYQAARANNGLLINCNGVPTSKQMAALQSRVVLMMADANAPAERPAGIALVDYARQHAANIADATDGADGDVPPF